MCAFKCSWLLAGVIAAALFQLAICEETSKNVAVLDSTSFDDFVSSGPFRAVVFHAPWCGHCRKLLPEWNAAADELAEDGTDIRMATLDGSEAKELMQRYELTAFPSVVLFFGDADTFLVERPPRERAELAQFLRRYASPAVVEVTTIEEANTVVKDSRESGAIVVAEFAEQMDPQFEKQANALRSKASFVTTHDPEVASVLGFNEIMGIGVLRSFEPFFVLVSGSVDDLAEIIPAVSMPRVMELSPSTASDILERKLPLAIVFTEGEDSDDRVRRAEPFFEGADCEHVLCVAINNKMFSAHQKRLGLPAEALVPAFAIDDVHNDNRYPLLVGPDDLSADAVAQHIETFLSGDLKPVMRSAPEPKQTGPIYELVGSTFLREVRESDRDALVMFYSPRCGHCKAMHPAYEELATLVKHVPGLLIASMDATENDVPERSVHLRGFPTVLFFKKGVEEHLEYSGNRSVGDMLSFLHQHASEPFDEAQDEL